MEPTRNTEGMSVEKVREMVAAMPENLHFIDMAETIYEGLCAMAGTEWETRSGPDLIARLPENEDGSDPRWKLLEHAPTLARMVVQEREAREVAERALALEQRAHALSVEQRDGAEDAANRLAYALYSVEEIGEHTNLNDPWANAAERLEGLAQPASTDDRAQVEARLVADFAPAMLAKLERARAKGRGGWEKPEECTVAHLWDCLQEHVWKSNLDMVDVGNLAAMIWHRLTHNPGEREQLQAHVAAQQPAPASAEALMENEWANIPLDMARVVVAVGDAGAAVTEIQDAEEHGRMMAESVRLTAEHFNQPDGPTAMYWVNVEGTDRVIAYTGTSPNSQEVSRALAGAWNLLRQHCQAALAAAEAGEA